MAKSKQNSQPSHLSQERVYNSSGSESNEGSDVESSPASRPKKLPLRETNKSKSSSKLQSKQSKPADPPSDTTSEDEEESSETESGEDNDEDEETSNQESSSESSKRKSPVKGAEQPVRKKTKPTPTTSTSTVQIAPRPFKAPHGYEPVILSASDFASNSASLFENLQGKQVWHISAPDSVSLDLIKELDIQAALQGKAILTKDGIDYNMHPTHVSSDVLLLPGGKNSTYEQSELTIAKSFHLRQMSSKPSQKTKDDLETPLIFTATEEGKARKPREQPGGLKMRYTPFGAPPAPQDATGQHDEDVEMTTETMGFKVPEEIVGERSSGKQSTNEEAKTPSTPRGEKRGKKNRDKERDTEPNEKKKKKNRRIVDE